MQFPESWLRAFCNPPLTSQQLADTLTMAGLEVEELNPVAPPFSQVVVGEIKASKKGVAIAYTNAKGEAKSLDADRLIVSIGRVPNTIGLN